MKLVRHSIYNLLGLGLPLVVAIFSIPTLIRELGEARFGLLTLIWAVVSYFGLFDLGLGRALTQQLSVALARDDHKDVGPLVATATVLMAALGVFAGLLMALTANWGVGLIQSVPDQQEAVNAVMLMALGMPFIILTSGFRGILEARHAFGVINAIRLPMGLFTFLGPVVVVLYGAARLDVVACILVIGRIVACIVHAWFAWRVLPVDHGTLAFQQKRLNPLCVSGGWMTVSNVISPFMGYVDRFIIGAVISAAAVAYYTTPQEIVTKLWVVPAALTAVLFPTFAAQAASGSKGTFKLFNNAARWIYLILMPVTVFLVLFPYEILSLWVGSEFAGNSSNLLKVFSVGILLNCLAHIPYTLIQGAGSPRATALVQAVELPLFLGALWWLSSSYGLLGAALAWLLRVALDAILMFALCGYIQKWAILQIFSFRMVICSVWTMFLFSGTAFESSAVRFSFVVLSLMTSILMIASSKLPKISCLFGGSNNG